MRIARAGTSLTGLGLGAILLATTPFAVQGAIFTGLGAGVPSYVIDTGGMAISTTEGPIVVGGVGFPVTRAVRWTSATGYVDLGVLPGTTDNYSEANAISANASTIVGESGRRAGTEHYDGFTWNSVNGMTLLPKLSGWGNTFPQSVNQNGVYVAGSAVIGGSIRPVRWNGTATPDLITTASGQADGIDYSGNVVAVTNRTTNTAQRWTYNTSVWTSRDVPIPSSSANGISGDGKTIFGVGPNFLGPGYAWTDDGTANGNLVDLGILTYPYSASYDGSVIVGTRGAHDGDDAICWTAATGAVNLNTYLPTLGVNLTGWTLDVVNSVSPDGITLTGYGFHNGVGENWLAYIPEKIPEPGALTLVVAAGVTLLRPARRRQRRLGASSPTV